jgi:hypothetical protein
MYSIMYFILCQVMLCYVTSCYVVMLSYRLVVGAPRGNSTYVKHQYIYQPGVVYQCGLRKGADCVQLLVDPSGKFCMLTFIKTSQSEVFGMNFGNRCEFSGLHGCDAHL